MSSAALQPRPAIPSANKAWLRALEMTAGIDAAPSRTFPVAVQDLGQRFGSRPALLSQSGNFSHAELAARANRYSRWALSQGIGKGTVVALLMPNCPDYLAIWLGITRIGGVVALINTHITGAALDHCLRAAGATHILVDETLAERLSDVSTGAKIWTSDSSFAQGIAAFGGEPLADHEHSDVTLRDPALLIYTSGTTGMPKAAYVSHHRVMMWTHWFAGMMGASADDRLYNCLPMYHSVGGVVASGAVLVAGGSVVLREKFSASQFWNDIATSGATIFQYIGELCRYLLNADTNVPAHSLRLACGNGLSGDVWEAFQKRFSIPQVLEFYAATEGNFSLYNAEGKPGSIGRVPPFLAHRFPVALVKPDDRGGWATVARGDAGEAIGKIAGGAARFEGYTDSGASAKKVLRDVFETGDAWVRTGDLMRQNAQGFFYFVDRLGDTFRWKGENVATTEVAAALTSFPGITAANVYGVAVPGSDGRAGMAALEVSGSLDLIGLKVHLASRLPSYARPVFLRIVPSLAITETFKQKRAELMQKGFDPAHTSDPLYCDLGNGYEPLDTALYARISSGRTRI